MIRGIGCDPDFKLAKSFYLDVYFRRSFDRAKMLEVLGMNKNISLKEAEQSFRRFIENGDVEGYWKLILLGIMQSDISFVDQICNEVIINKPKRLMEIMPKAYTKLLLSK